MSLSSGVSSSDKNHSGVIGNLVSRDVCMQNICIIHTHKHTPTTSLFYLANRSLSPPPPSSSHLKSLLPSSSSSSSSKSGAARLLLDPFGTTALLLAWAPPAPKPRESSGMSGLEESMSGLNNINKPSYSKLRKFPQSTILFPLRLTDFMDNYISK